MHQSYGRFTLSDKSLQNMMRAAIAEQGELSKLSLRYLQISANKHAVERIFEERASELNRALEAYKKGKYYFT